MILSYQSILERMRKDADDPTGQRLGVKSDEPGEDLTLLLDGAGMNLRLSKHGTMYFPGVREGTITPRSFHRAMTMETLSIPEDVMGYVSTVSTLARLGLSVTTDSPWLKPGWRGQVMLEITSNGEMPVRVLPGIPIAYVTFIKLDARTSKPYDGAHQDQTESALQSATNRYDPTRHILKLK